MAASKPQILILYGTFYLPIVSLAVLTGFVVSLSLPAASALFILLTQLSNAFFSWITPPCLFLLLNGIIFVLTANSGMFSSSASSSGSFEFCTNFLGKIERYPKQSSEALMKDFSPAILCTNLSAKMQNQSFSALMVEVSALSTHRPCAVFDEHGTCQEERGRFYDCKGADDYGEEEEEEEEKEAAEDKEEKEEEEEPFTFSKLAMESRSFSFSCAQMRINEEENEDDLDEDGDEWASSRHSKQAMVNKKLSFFCRENDDYVQTKSRSVPTSPHYATPPKPTIKRSLSVDSASYHGNQAASLPSPESLSDEAFRKRIEGFISKMNAQLRNEVK